MTRTAWCPVGVPVNNSRDLQADNPNMVNEAAIKKNRPEAGYPLVQVEGLSVRFNAGRSGFWGQRPMVVHAVENVSLAIMPGETLGLVGESGSGKSTTGRAILRRVPAAQGSIFFKGRDITRAGPEELRPLRRHMQLVFQDPYSSLNPRMRIIEIVAEPLVVHGMAKSSRDAAIGVADLLRRVGLPPDAGDRYPHAFSGGQRQRVGIARALALNPEFIVADEPVSALDVSIRAQIVNLLQDLQRDLGIAYLFIAHDLAVVRHISHRIAIMYAGKLMEIAARDEIYEKPLHPYTRALLSAVPVPDPKAQRIRRRIAYSGEPPNPLDPPPGCRFQSRCAERSGQCRLQDPPLEERRPGHHVACWNC
jgi:peptide/nickel transport system ATP-binding protein